MAQLTYEQALLQVLRLEIENGTQRSVAAVYTLLLPFMLQWQKDTGSSLRLPAKYSDIHKAIRQRWPANDGITALSKVKDLAWKNYEAVAKTDAPTEPPEGQRCSNCDLNEPEACPTYSDPPDDGWCDSWTKLFATEAAING